MTELLLQIGAQVPGYFTYGTVEKLAARTQYEFKVEAMRLLFDRPGETAGPTSSVVTAITLCSGKLENNIQVLNGVLLYSKMTIPII